MTTHSHERRLITVNDLYTLQMASDVQLSPDGNDVLFVQTWLDEGHNDYRSSLMVVDVNSRELRRLTWTDARDSHPRWSPDGTQIAFLSSRSDGSQIFLLPVSGGEPRQLTALKEGVSAFAWSNGGDKFAFVSKSTDDEKSAEEQPASDVMYIRSIRYKKNGVPGILDDKRSHLWTVDIETGTPTQLTRGDFDDTAPVWTPDDREVIFNSDRSDLRDFERDQQIWAVSVESREIRSIAGNDNDIFRDPAVSPDGRHVAFRGHRNAEAKSSVNNNVWTVAIEGGEPFCRTKTLDRSTDDSTAADFYGKSSPGLIWSSDSQRLYYQVSDQGAVHLYSSRLGQDAVPVITGKRRVLDFSVNESAGRIAFVISDALNPADVWVCDLDGSNEQQLTAINESLLSKIDLAEPEEHWVPSHNEDQWPIHTWILKPPHFQEGERYPMVLTIHGGPHGMYGQAFFHEFQVLAAQGYVVVYANPRASQGYGQEFLGSTNANWGVADMPDLMAVVDFVIDQGYIDVDRLGVTGGSYGGFMTNWIIAHSDRFRAAITDRCVSNLTSMFGTSDVGFSFGEREWGGPPWADREFYWKYSPISYVEQMTTPLLIVHSEQDHRCPIEQGEQLYVSLKKLGRTTEFVRFPDENHELSRSGQPHHRAARLNSILDWWERYL